MTKKREKIAFMTFILLFMVSNTHAYETNSTNYKFDFVISSGDQTNTTSTSYQNKLILGIISKVINSTNFVNRVGFLYTTFYLDGEQCLYNYECLGGYCCSNVCQSTSCPAEEVAEGAAAGAGGMVGVSDIIVEEEKIDFKVTPTSIRIELIIGKSATKTIKIMNTGNTDLSGTINVVGLENFISLSDYDFYIDVGGSFNVNMDITADGVGIFTGKIILKAGDKTKVVPFVIEVETEKALFDVKMDIPLKYRTIKQGQDLRAQITLFNVMESKIDVYVTYLIKDLSGNILFEESETFMVDRQKSYTKKFYTRKFKPGTYVAVIEVRYANSYAVSSQMFDVSEEKAIILEVIREFSFIIIGAFFITALIIVISIPRFKIRIKRKK